MKVFLWGLIAFFSSKMWAQNSGVPAHDFDFASSPKDCVNLYYDKSEDSTYWMGRTYSIFLQNLLGHFPELQQRVSPIEYYKAGEIDECRATIYLGSHFAAKIPDAFLEDFVKTKKNVAWLGYGIWHLKEKFETIFGYKYISLTNLNNDILTKEKQPTFYRDILYKGEVFSKFSEVGQNDPKQFLAAFEMAALQETEASRSEVLARALHSGTSKILPYVIRAKNHFYIADIPFSFMHEKDRYLVFADILFDIVDLPPRHNGKYAFLRLEDISPMIGLPELYKVTKVLEEEQVPIQISLIPIFSDPLHDYFLKPQEEMITMDRVPSFMTFIKEMQRKKAKFIWHGVTHQYSNIKNPHSGVSGDDFEFWDAVRDKPLDMDSASFVLNRMEEGLYTLRKAGIRPRMWLTPHYQSSSLDNIIFGKIFEWNIGRLIYFDHQSSGLPINFGTPLSSLWLESTDPKAKMYRQNYFKDLKVNYNFPRWSGQMFPYEIYGDLHGQRIIPENIGNCQPYLNSHVVRPRSYKDIINDAKRNLVLRDNWASFFYHVNLVDSHKDGGRGAYPGDTSELREILRQIKSFGYRFVDANDFMDKTRGVIRPEPLYRCSANDNFSSQCKGN